MLDQPPSPHLAGNSLRAQPAHGTLAVSWVLDKAAKLGIEACHYAAGEPPPVHVRHVATVVFGEDVAEAVRGLRAVTERLVAFADLG